MISGIGIAPIPIVPPLTARPFICLACRCRNHNQNRHHGQESAVAKGRGRVPSVMLADHVSRKSLISTRREDCFPINIPQPRQSRLRDGTEMGKGSLMATPTPSSGTLFSRPNRNGSQQRTFTSRRALKQQSVSAAQSTAYRPTAPPHVPPANPIRAQLLQWQTQHEKEEADDPVVRSHESMQSAPGEYDEESERLAEYSDISAGEPGGSVVDTFMRMGDLVEFRNASGLYQLALYIRKSTVGNTNQIYTAKGQMTYVRDAAIAYSVPSFVPAEEVEPMLEHFPAADSTDEELSKIRQEAYYVDISVPREISAPLIQKLRNFQDQSKAIYRDHAQTLDNAHDLLAHQTDLQYSSLRATASTLLNREPHKLSDPDIYAVHQAITHAGFSFGTDLRTRRSTGHLQIRSKELVQTVKSVRNWIHAWQDDVARKANLEPHKRKAAPSPYQARIIYGFIAKARQAILKSREDRQPLVGGLGPSKQSFPLEPGSQVIRELVGQALFTGPELQVVHFIEAWCLAQMFREDLSLESLSPALISATGLYRDLEVDASGGAIFLAELGVVPPYLNRAAFDPHLLLPTSQHSVPLRRLAVRLSKMKTDPGFQDSMAHLRRDWGDLTVFCVDGAQAAEIDDGFSIEDAGASADGKATYWIHTHIANPTAFFQRDHPLAQMCRHMGETVYMPDQTYTMLPPWAANSYFSLKKDRCCLTFSTLLDESGNQLERKITPGIVRNVKSLTPEAFANFVADDDIHNTRPYLLTIGGAIPPPQAHSVSSSTLTSADKGQLSKLRDLASKLHSRRSATGGLSFDQRRPECIVKSELERPGLGWQYPLRRGGRSILGDPAIQTQVHPLRNWFEPAPNSGNEVVQEVMLLACETAGHWCRERKIPGLFRGTVPRPGQQSSPEAYYEEVLAPAAEKHGGRYTLEMGLGYLQTFGGTVMATQAVKHRILGMSAYLKVTSPLRRYGDMIMHWQIEAALRQEAETGRSLITNNEDAGRTFLPFSATTLETIMVGLKARERLIMQTKGWSNIHWFNQMLFRAHNFGARLDTHVTADLPHADHFVTLQRLPEVVHVHILVASGRNRQANMVEFDGLFPAYAVGDGLQEKPMVGDVWQARVKSVDTYTRRSEVELVKLLYRIGEDGYAGWFGEGPPLDLPGRS